MNPKLVLADEPTGNLDTQRTHEVSWRCCASCVSSAGWRSVLATHDPQAAAIRRSSARIARWAALAIYAGTLRLYRAHDARRKCDRALDESSPTFSFFTVRAWRQRPCWFKRLFAMLGIAGWRGVAVLLAGREHQPFSLGGTLDPSASLATRSLQLDARGPAALTNACWEKARHIPGVAALSRLIEQQANVRGPHGERSVDMLGVDPHRFTSAARSCAASRPSSSLLSMPSRFPTAIAGAIGAGPLRNVEVQVRGRISEALLGAVLSQSDIGALANGEVSDRAGGLRTTSCGYERRINRIFVRTKPGQSAMCASRLNRACEQRGSKCAAGDLRLRALFRVAS